MAVYQIVQLGEDILRQKAQEVKKITPNIHKLLDNMAETMYEANGVGRLPDLFQGWSLISGD